MMTKKNLYSLVLALCCTLLQPTCSAVYNLKTTFLHTAAEFTKLRTTQMDTAAWLNKQTGADKNQQPAATRFVQKLEIPNNAQVKFLTDLHGEAQTLCDWLKQGQKNGFFSKNNPFKIAKPTDYIILLGDYVDRGPDSMATLINVMQLYLNNPDRVIIIKGNHEDRNIYTHYGFGKEACYDKAILAAADEVFTKLPSACYLTWKDAATKTHSILCTHGGPDISYNPQALLAGAKNHEWVHANLTALHSIITNQRAYQAAQCYFAHNPTANLFAWTDFNTQERIGHPVFHAGRLQLCLNTLINYHITTQVPHVVQHGIIRGHQHGDLEETLARNNGVHLLHSDLQFRHPWTTIAVNSLTQASRPFVITVGPGTSRVTLTLHLDKNINKCRFSRQTIRA